MCIYNMYVRDEKFFDRPASEGWLMETLMLEPAKPVSLVPLTIAQWPVKILNIIILLPFSFRTTDRQQSYDPTRPWLTIRHESRAFSVQTINTELLSRICLRRSERSVEIKSGINAESTEVQNTEIIRENNQQKYHTKKKSNKHYQQNSG